nr:MAG TPA: Bacterial DNA-binding protein [Caudoviricetes sp.]
MINLNTFVEVYSKKNNLPKTKSKEEILRFIETYKETTIENNGICINGFLTSQVVSIPEKKCVNPKTGKKINVPAKNIVKIRISPKFKKMED